MSPWERSFDVVVVGAVAEFRQGSDAPRIPIARAGS
jgi:hypothetical protein